MGLTQKNLLFTSALVIALVGSTLAYTTREADRLAQGSVRKTLIEGRAIWSSYEKDRYATLKRGVRVLSNDPAFKAAVETMEHATVVDLLRERGQDLGADFFIATTRDGRVIARSDNVEAQGQDLSQDPVVRKPLEGEESPAAVWKQGEQVFQAVSVPMRFGPKLVGVLIAGYLINESLALQVRDVTHSDIVFLSRGANGRSILSAWSLDSTKATALRDRLAQADFAPAATEPFETEFGGLHYVALQAPLRAATGEVVGSVLFLRSLSEEMAAYERFRKGLILIAALVMGLGLGFAYLGSTRITGPLKRLLELVERARDGSYAGTVEVASRDEVGALARNFNSLLKDLREKEQVIAFLRGGTNPFAAAPSKASQSTAKIAALSANVGVTVEKGSYFAGRYEILGALGSGGMGVVYRARDKQLDEIMALKVIRAEIIKKWPAVRENFKNEIKLARKVTHRNVVRTYDFGEAEGVPYMTMEYLEGATLKDLIVRRGAPPLAVGFRFARQMCLGLIAAHGEGVLHRDIKPQNMLILPESGELKIMDFGVAQAIDTRGEGPSLGTAQYASPEQAAGKDLDVRSDIYSLGIVFFELFTGQLPFGGETDAEVLRHHAETPPPHPRRVVPAVPQALDAVIIRCLRKLRADRYQTVTDVLADLLAASA